MSRTLITRGGAERVPELQPLWQSLHEHHAGVAPQVAELGPVRTPAESWAIRRQLYDEWLAEPDAFVLVAERDSAPVGYALVHGRGSEETWAVEQIAQLETLTVLPGYRGEGVGMALVEAVYGELRRLGVRHMAVGVIAANADAVRFYEGLGMQRFVIAYLGDVPPAAGS